MSTSRWQGKRAMVVDDDVVMLEVTRERLEFVGFEVTTRSSSYGTSAAILKERPHVALIDVGMPGLSGDEVAAIVNERVGADRTTVILHSSGDRATLERLAHRSGAAGIIEKTSSIEQFLAQLEACLDTPVSSGRPRSRPGRDRR
jgi:DNA-binding response OmpR family regulator